MTKYLDELLNQFPPLLHPSSTTPQIKPTITIQPPNPMKLAPTSKSPELSPNLDLDQRIKVLEDMVKELSNDNIKLETSIEILTNNTTKLANNMNNLQSHI